MRSWAWLMVVVFGVAFSLNVGCIPTPADNAGKTGTEEGHDHDHDDHEGHDHHMHGPHNGHIVELGEEEYHAEWTHDDSGLIAVYILDKAAKEEVPIAAEKITISVTTKKSDGDTTVEYDLLPANPSEGDMPKASRFELTDKALLGSLETLTPGAVEAMLTLVIDGTPFQSAITHDEHHH